MFHIKGEAKWAICKKQPFHNHLFYLTTVESTTNCKFAWLNELHYTSASTAKPFGCVRSKAHNLDNPRHSLFEEIDSSAQAAFGNRDEVLSF